MSAMNPLISIAQPMAEGSGWAISRSNQGISLHIMRDDGNTFLGAYMERGTFAKATLLARVNASTGITANEQARVAAAGASTQW